MDLKQTCLQVDIRFYSRDPDAAWCNNSSSYLDCNSLMTQESDGVLAEICF